MASAIVGALRVVLSMDTAEFDSAAKQVSASAKTWTKDFGRIGEQATSLGRTLTASLTLPLVGIATASAKAAIDFESSFAGVGKTVDGVMDAGGRLTEFGQKLSMEFRALSKEIPISVNELNKIGEAAGQLGIKKENLVDFTSVMAQLGVTTNLSSDQAATSLARLANITGMSQNDFDRLGSTIVGLGNNFATTESEIVDFGLRIAGAGKIAGLTESEILGIGTAMSSIGVQAEAGGTAVQKVLNDMTEAVATGNDHLAVFARTAGQSAGDFAKMFKEDAAGAFTAFVEGLGVQGDKAFGTLDKLGLGNERVIRAFLSLAGAGDLLKDAIGRGNVEWERNTALTEEAQKRFSTTASQLTLLWNRIKDVGITLGNALLPAIQTLVKWTGNLIPVIESAAKWFSALPGPVQATGLAFLGVVAAAGPALYLFGQLAFAAQSLTAVFVTNGIAMTSFRGIAAGLSAPLASLFGVFSSGTTAVTLLGRAFAVLTGPVGWIVGGVSGILTATGTWDEFFRILKAGATIVYNFGEAVVTGIGAAIKWLGDITGITEIVTGAVRLLGSVLKIVAGDIAWFMDKLAIAMEGLAAVTGGIERELAKADIASPFKKLIESGLAPAIDATKYLTAEQDKQAKSASALGAAQEKSAKEIAKAKKEAEKAAKEHEQAIEKEKQALSALGLVTEEEVNEKIVELTQLQDAATKKGVPLVASLKAQETVLKALAAKAKESGVEFKHLTLLIADLDRQIRELSPTPQALPIKMGLPAVITGLKEVSLGMSKARFDASELWGAYETLGVKTTASLAAQAQAARDAYRIMLESGTATAEQLKAARQSVLEAEIAAGQATVGVWEGLIKPAVHSVIDGISASVAQGVTDLIGHWNRAGEIFAEIWQGIKNTFLNVLQSMLDSFINGFLKGLLSGINASGIGEALGRQLSGRGGGGGNLPPVGPVGPGGVGPGLVGLLESPVGQLGTSLAIFDLLLPGDTGLIKGMIDAWKNPYTPEQTPLERGQELFDYMGPDSWAFQEFLKEFPELGSSFGIPGFAGGTNGQYLDFGSGTLAMLHGPEKITPLGAEVDGQSWGGGGVTVILEQDGRKTAQWFAPYLVDEVFRLRLA